MLILLSHSCLPNSSLQQQLLYSQQFLLAAVVPFPLPGSFFVVVMYVRRNPNDWSEQPNVQID